MQIPSSQDSGSGMEKKWHFFLKRWAVLKIWMWECILLGSIKSFSGIQQYKALYSFGLLARAIVSLLSKQMVLVDCYKGIVFKPLVALMCGTPEPCAIPVLFNIYMKTWEMSSIGLGGVSPTCVLQSVILYATLHIPWKSWTWATKALDGAKHTQIKH